MKHCVTKMHYKIKYKSHGSKEVCQYLRHSYGGNIYSLFNFQDVEQVRIIEEVGRREDYV